MKLLSEVNWYGRAMGRYASFSGRATRSEYWYFTLVSGLMGVGAALTDDTWHTGGILYLLVTLVHAIPSLSVFVRRMHDTGRSGWWFWAVFTVVGIIPVFVFLCQRSEPAANRYGAPDDPGGSLAAVDPTLEPTPAWQGSARDPIQEIERLAELRTRGAITDAEFDRMKAAVLATPPVLRIEPRI